MTDSSPPRTRISRAGHARALELRRQLADELRRHREDAGLSQRRLAGAAGVSQSIVSQLEAAQTDPGIEVLARLGAALGGRLTTRIDPGIGTPVRDHIQAAIVECLLGAVSRRWVRLPEVAVYRPVRGVIDIVFHDPRAPVIVATEVQSELRRMEQQLRWLGAKADALASGGTSQEVTTALGLGRDETTVHRLLVLRSTDATRRVVAAYRQTLSLAYPAPYAATLDSLLHEAPWPGSALLWAEVAGGVAEIRDRPPRGLDLVR